MEKNITCSSCGATWKVFIKEGVSIAGELVSCPLCKVPG